MLPGDGLYKGEKSLTVVTKGVRVMGSTDWLGRRYGKRGQLKGERVILKKWSFSVVAIAP